MKKIILITFCFLTSSYCFAQKITVSDLQALFDMNATVADASLIAKNYQYHNSSASSEDSFAEVTYAKNKDYYSDKASSWLSFYKDEDKNNVKLVLQINNKTDYLQLLKVIKTNYKFIGDDINDEYISSSYENSKFYTTVKSIKTEGEYDNSTTTYSITLIKKFSLLDPNNGLKKTYHDNGILKEEYHIVNGVLNGTAETYSEDGDLKSIITFKNGQKVGPAKYFDKEGNISSIENHINASLVEVEEFKDKKLVYKYSVIDGKTEGKFLKYEYDDSGNLEYKTISNYTNDELNGFRVLYDSENDTLEYGFYRNDKKNGKFKEYTASDTIEYSTYINDVKNGEYKIYTFIEVTNQKTFNKENIVDEWERGYYVNGLKNGNVINSFLGNKYSEGLYKDGEKSGKWITYCMLPPFQNQVSELNYYNDGKLNGTQYSYISQTDDSDSTEFKVKKLYVESNFVDDKLEGTKIAIDSLAQIKIVFNYKDDMLNGKTTFYKKDVLDLVVDYSNDIAKQTSFYENNVRTKMNIYDFSSKDIKLTSVYFNLDTTETYNYKFDGNKDDFNIYKYNPAESVLDGQYEIKVNNSLLYSGTYKDGAKSGISRRYFNTINVYSEIDNSSPDLIEKFYTNDHLPFKGKIEYQSNTSKIKFSVKDGVIDGKYQTYDLLNNLISEIKYKKGLLIN